MNIFLNMPRLYQSVLQEHGDILALHTPIPSELHDLIYFMTLEGKRPADGYLTLRQSVDQDMDKILSTAYLIHRNYHKINVSTQLRAFAAWYLAMNQHWDKAVDIASQFDTAKDSVLYSAHKECAFHHIALFRKLPFTNFFETDEMTPEHREMVMPLFFLPIILCRPMSKGSCNVFDRLCKMVYTDETDETKLIAHPALHPFYPCRRISRDSFAAQKPYNINSAFQLHRTGRVLLESSASMTNLETAYMFTRIFMMYPTQTLRYIKVLPTKKLNYFIHFICREARFTPPMRFRFVVFQWHRVVPQQLVRAVQNGSGPSQSEMGTASGMLYMLQRHTSLMSLSENFGDDGVWTTTRVVVMYSEILRHASLKRIYGHPRNVRRAITTLCIHGVSEKWPVLHNRRLMVLLTCSHFTAGEREYILKEGAQNLTNENFEQLIACDDIYDYRATIAALINNSMSFNFCYARACIYVLQIWGDKLMDGDATEAQYKVWRLIRNQIPQRKKRRLC